MGQRMLEEELQGRRQKKSVQRRFVDVKEL